LVSADGQVQVTNTTSSSSTVTGAMVVTGGVGVAGATHAATLSATTQVDTPSIVSDAGGTLSLAGSGTTTLNMGLLSVNVNVGTGTTPKILTIGASLDTITFGAGILLPTASATATALNFYQESTSSMTFGGGLTPSAAFNVRFTRVGNLVTVQWPDIQGATANSSIFSNTVPTVFRPTGSTLYKPMSIIINGTRQTGRAGIVSGTLFFEQQNGGGFVASGTGGAFAGGFTYSR
jgi:hypothetical protein